LTFGGRAPGVEDTLNYATQAYRDVTIDRAVVERSR
jgi:hypothetical protein